MIEPLIPDAMEQEFSLLDYYTLTRDNNIILSYKGPVTDHLISEISRDIRGQFSEKPKAAKKMFSAFIELAQNIHYYSAEKAQFCDNQESIGSIVIAEKENAFYLSCGNLIENEGLDKISHKCERINTLDREGLREFKREERNKRKDEDRKGAGIGLIQVALLSSNPINLESSQINDKFSFFSLTVKINQD